MDQADEDIARFLVTGLEIVASLVDE